MHSKYSYLDTKQIMPTMNLESTWYRKNERFMFYLLIINKLKRVCIQCNKEGELHPPYFVCYNNSLRTFLFRYCKFLRTTVFFRCQMLEFWCLETWEFCPWEECEKNSKESTKVPVSIQLQEHLAFSDLDDIFLFQFILCRWLIREDISSPELETIKVGNHRRKVWNVEAIII